jgi:predicted component of type VI protein secretion system
VEERHFALDPGENILGRTRGNLTFPEDAFLSSQHCKIVARAGSYVLEDIHAVNGTFVAIRERTSLNDGDILLIGHQLLRVTVVPA